MIKDIDILVVGAGPAGIVSARKLAEAGKKVLLIEKKNHIAGHCYDELNEDGVYIHKYGPHIFHTDYQDVWEFVSQFTKWHYYHHMVLGAIDGNLVPIPFNFNTIDKLLPRYMIDSLTKKLVDNFGFGNKVPILELRNSDDKDIQFLAELVYQKIFLNYTAKQWGKNPDEIDPSVSGRVPVVLSRDNRYFHDRYQGIPLKGYTALFEKMLDHENITLCLNTERSDVFKVINDKIMIDGTEFHGDVIYTGMIDELFNFSEGELPYRSTNMVFEEYNFEYYQENSLVNYPNNYNFTRITEFKHFQKSLNSSTTTICKEFPQEYVRGENDPYYVINDEKNQLLYNKYKMMADNVHKLHMVGRLANYRYYDMDDVIKAALNKVDDILGGKK